MSESEPYSIIIQKARNLVKGEKLAEAENEFKKAISILEKRLDGSDKSKAELWCTKAEFLKFRGSFLYKKESFEDSRKRHHDAIRYLYKCSKINEEYSKQVSANMRKYLNGAIRMLGCIVPENDTNVTVSCPIKIRNTGLGMSIGTFYKRALCSICDLDMLDERCNHVPGNNYKEKTCVLIPDGMEVDHVSITNSPKDPRCLLSSVKISIQNFTEEQIKNKIGNNLPIVCSLCKKNNIDPSEISVEKFFEMQGLDLEID